MTRPAKLPSSVQCEGSVWKRAVYICLKKRTWWQRTRCKRTRCKRKTRSAERLCCTCCKHGERFVVEEK